MRDFVQAQLLSQSTLQSGLFDSKALKALVDTYYTEGRGAKEIVLALDLALAARHFGASA
jgi:hypothetical protein